MDKLLSLPAHTLITTGRTGTDLLHSLLDSHPEVLLFNGHLRFHDFWKLSKCRAAGSFAFADLLEEFVGKFIHRFKSRYDLEERKDQLGSEFDQVIDIDLKRFKNEAVKLMEGHEVNSRNSLVAIYAAYAICLGQDLDQKKMFFHHVHRFEYLDGFMNDFPESKVICMTRDPRANFVSGIENWRKYNSNSDQGSFLYYYIKRILADATVLDKLPNEYIVIRIEDLGKDPVLRNLCNWLGLSYNECLKRSTWAGLSWHGDKLSRRPNKEAGWSGAMLQNKWGSRLNPFEKRVFNYIMYYRLKHYGYPTKDITPFDAFVVPFLVLMPLTFELRYFSISYLRKRIKNKDFLKILANFICYFRRIRLFYRYYWHTLRRTRFSCRSMGDTNLFCPVCELEREVRLLGKYRGRNSLFNNKSLYQCCKCMLIFVDPMPKSHELDWYYKNVWIKDETIVSSSNQSQLVYQIQAEERLKYLSRNIDLGKVTKVLDIGSGFGYLFDAFAKHGLKGEAFYASDPSPDNLTRLKAKGIQAFADFKDIKEHDFDLVTLCFVLEHINEPYKFMLSVMDHVKDGGYIFLDLPERDDTFKPVLEPHVAVYTATSLNNLADKLGLEVIHMTGYGKERVKLIAEMQQPKGLLGRLKGFIIGRLGRLRRLDDVRRLYQKYHFDREGQDCWWIRAILRKKA